MDAGSINSTKIRQRGKEARTIHAINLDGVGGGVNKGIGVSTRSITGSIIRSTARKEVCVCVFVCLCMCVHVCVCVYVSVLRMKCVYPT